MVRLKVCIQYLQKTHYGLTILIKNLNLKKHFLRPVYRESGLQYAL